MKGALLLAVITFLSILFCSQCTETKSQPENTTEQVNPNSNISQDLNDTISDTLKHYEKHNSVPE